MRTIAAILLVAAPATVISFTRPSEDVVRAIREHSLPDRLHVVPLVDSHCDIPDTDLTNTIDGVLIRSRVEDEFFSDMSLIVDVICLRRNPGYAYHVEPKFAIVADGGYVLVIHGTYLSVIGTANSSDRILAAIKEQVEDAVTVFIFAHRD